MPRVGASSRRLCLVHLRRTGTVLGGPGLCEGVADPEVWPNLRNLIRVRTKRNGPHRRR